MKTQICYNILVWLAFGVIVAAMGACQPTRRMADGEYLLRRNKVELKGSSKVNEEAIQDIIRPEPNRRILGVLPFYLWAYNVPDPSKFAEKDSKRLKRLEEKNVRRAAKGKSLKEFNEAGSWWRETVGEPPVLVDTAMIRRSSEQIQTYMIKHGWFNARVATAIVPTGRTMQREVVYTIFPGTPYTIDSLKFDITDPGVMSRVERVRKERPQVQEGKQFNVDAMDGEREAITALLRNEGYFDFNKELLYYDVDSALGKHMVHLTLGLQPRLVPIADNPDSLQIMPYKRYTINKITITDQMPFGQDEEVQAKADTTYIGGYTVIDRGQLQIKPRILAQNILFNPMEPFRANRVTTTYRRLSSLSPIRSANIRFSPISKADDNTMLNCIISTTPSPRQSIALEGRGTNRGGFLGIQGSISYKNRNILGGAEILEVNLRGGLEAQQLLTGSASGIDDAAAQAERNIAFNTVEFGPEISLTLPRFLLPIKPERFAKSANPRTTFRANLNYQRRPDYERARSFASLSYRWSDTEEKEWIVSPIEISLITIEQSDLFRQQLEEINNIFLTNSFNDHFIAAGRVVYIQSNQRPGSLRKNSIYFRSEFESAGSLLRALSQIADRPADSLGSYKVLDINFAQYLKTLQELRFLRVHNDKMSTAYRFIGGVGVPLQNLNVLPFEKAFFGGGANDIRAWQARTLGPGSFRDPERNFDKIGDILLEANIEYRFALAGVIEGAFFADAGNIWNIRKDPQRPGADFAFDRFWEEIAIGLGFGIRLNFDFFIVRLDAGLQTRDPSLDRGERWIFQSKSGYNAYIEELNAERAPNNQLSTYTPRWNLNLGIGYPF